MIAVGMSGGVDSSVTALLLKRQGLDVCGVFMNNWEEKDESGVCTSARDWDDVRRVCDLLDIPSYSVNFAREYRERVFSYFLDEYRRMRTPNPDVLCNREIKFGVFLDFCRGLGADGVATGHFARLDKSGDKPLLLRAADENKDQTYFLHEVGWRQLALAHFPVGGMTKAQIRDQARRANIPVSEKKDSTGVCFIGERDFKPFLMKYMPAQPGDMVDESGRVVGRHDGLMFYTLGQRRGLGVGGGGNGGRWFVVEKDVANNRLVLSQGDESRLYASVSYADRLTWISGEAPAEDGEPFPCQIRLRHRQPLQDAVVTIDNGVMRMDFAQPQRAVTPGQYAVVYQGQVCLGGGEVK